MTSFRDFWPLYLQAHRHRGTRIGHYAATTIALATIAASINLMIARRNIFSASIDSTRAGLLMMLL